MLDAVTDELWVVGHELRMLGIDVRGRMTVVRLATGGLWIHSPVPIDDALARELADLGPVEHIVAPSRLHHLHVPGAVSRDPDAQLHGSPGLVRKLRDLAFDSVLDGATPEAWGCDLEMQRIRGTPMFDEVVFHHRPSGTLVCADLLMNIHICQGWLSRLLMRLDGVWMRLAVPRMWRLLTWNRASARASVEPVMGWSVTRIIPAHGEVVEVDAQSALATAFRWLRIKALPATPSS